MKYRKIVSFLVVLVVIFFGFLFIGNRAFAVQCVDGQNPTSDHPYNGAFEWKANCNKSCRDNGDCASLQNSWSGAFTPSTTTWCFGFDNNVNRCLAIAPANNPQGNIECTGLSNCQVTQFGTNNTATVNLHTTWQKWGACYDSGVNPPGFNNCKWTAAELCVQADNETAPRMVDSWDWKESSSRDASIPWITKGRNYKFKLYETASDCTTDQCNITSGASRACKGKLIKEITVNAGGRSSSPTTTPGSGGSTPGSNSGNSSGLVTNITARGVSGGTVAAGTRVTFVETATDGGNNLSRLGMFVTKEKEPFPDNACPGGNGTQCADLPSECASAPACVFDSTTGASTGSIPCKNVNASGVGNWCQIKQQNVTGSSGQTEASFTFNTPGKYVVIANAAGGVAADGSRRECSGNPYVEYTPKYSIWDPCGSNSKYVLTVAEGPTPTPPPTHTSEYQIADNPQFYACGSTEEVDWKSFSEAQEDTLNTDFEFCDKQPGIKILYVRFKNSLNQIQTDPEVFSKKIRYIGANPAITNLDCQFDPSGTGTKVVVTGTNLGETRGAGLVNINGQPAEVESWALTTDTSPTATPAQNPDTTLTPVPTLTPAPSPASSSRIVAKFGQKLEGRFPVVVRTNDGRQAAGVCSIGTTSVSLKALVQCRPPENLAATGVQVRLFKDTAGAQPQVLNTTITADGTVGGLDPKLEVGRRYALEIKAPKTISEVKRFEAKQGTNILDTIDLKVGDIAPPANPNNKVDIFDFSQLYSQWSSTKDVTRTADFNLDGRVNSIDYSCMRANFNRQGDVYNPPSQ